MAKRYGTEKTREVDVYEEYPFLKTPMRVGNTRRIIPLGEWTARETRIHEAHLRRLAAEYNHVVRELKALAKKAARLKERLAKAGACS